MIHTKILILLFVVLLSSCSITSRRYMPGYHVEWNSSRITPKNTSSHISIDNSMVSMRAALPIIKQPLLQITKPLIALSSAAHTKLNHSVKTIHKQPQSLIIHALPLIPLTARDNTSRQSTSKIHNVGKVAAIISLALGILLLVGTLIFFASLGAIFEDSIYPFLVIKLIVISGILLSLLAYGFGKTSHHEIGNKTTAPATWNLARAGIVLSMILIVVYAIIILV